MRLSSLLLNRLDKRRESQDPHLGLTICFLSAKHLPPDSHVPGSMCRDGALAIDELHHLRTRKGPAMLLADPGQICGRIFERRCCWPIPLATLPMTGGTAQQVEVFAPLRDRLFFLRAPQHR